MNGRGNGGRGSVVGNDTGAAVLALTAPAPGAGRARTPALPAGRYYVFSALVVNKRPMVWQLPVDLRAGSNAVTLDLASAYAVD